MDRLVSFFGVVKDDSLPFDEAETWPLGLAPFIRLAEDGSGNRVVEAGQFGLMPPFKAELAYGRKTYNARAETVDTLVTYKGAWVQGQRCVIPAECIFEPCWETGTAVRWRIQQAGEVPMGIAGIYRRTRSPLTDKPMFSFSMLTVNSAGHPVFRRMHRPNEEKRMVVILEPEDYGPWLSCRVDEARDYWRQWIKPLEAFPDPLPSRQRKPKEAVQRKPGPAGQSADLF